MTEPFVGAGDWAAIVASAVAVVVVALAYTWWTTRKQLAMSRDLAETARRQADLQREVFHASQSPNVWFDIWVDDQQAAMLLFRLGNSGTAVARNVVVTVDPPLEPTDRSGRKPRDVQASLSNGISYLPPGRVIEWSLGVVFDVVARGPVREWRVSIAGDGPFGAFTVPDAVVRLDDIKDARAAPPGTLHGVTLAIDQVTKIITKRHDQAMYDREVAEAEEEARDRAKRDGADGT